MFSLNGIWKNWRKLFSLSRNLHYLSWNKVFFHKTVKLAIHKRRQFLKEISIRRKISSPSSSLPLEGIIGSTFRKKWKIKTMVFSKSIIGSHHKVLGFTWLFYFHFAEKCVETLGQGFCFKFFCFHVLVRSQLFLTYIRIVRKDR